MTPRPANRRVLVPYQQALDHRARTTSQRSMGSSAEKAHMEDVLSRAPHLVDSQADRPVYDKNLRTRSVGQRGTHSSTRNKSCADVRFGGNSEQGTIATQTRATPGRMTAFSDAVFAVLITVLVLELRPPEFPTFDALLLLWPTWLSYAVSYMFIAIVWINHHHLMRYASEVTLHLMWFNFAHLFSVSLLPLATAWMAVSKLAPQPVAFYAAVSVLVNVTYVLLLWNLIGRIPVADVSPAARRIIRVRSIATLCLFGVAGIVALSHPLLGLGISCLCPILYLNPDAPGAGNRLLRWNPLERGSTANKLAQASS